VTQELVNIAVPAEGGGNGVGRKPESATDAIGGTLREQRAERLAKLAEIVVGHPRRQVQRFLGKGRHVFQNGLHILELGPVAFL